VILVDRNGVVASDTMIGEIEQLTYLAAAVLIAHTDEGRRCAVCSGKAFPCLAAELARQAVALRR